MSKSGFLAWTPAERRVQLAEFSRLCAALAAVFQPHDPRASAEFRERAEGAGALLADGWEQQHLNELAADFPDGAWWLNPKAADYNAPREPWQEAAAELHSQASSLAIDLRAIAIQRD